MNIEKTIEEKARELLLSHIESLKQRYGNKEK